jgi:hypothetical protein
LISKGIYKKIPIFALTEPDLSDNKYPFPLNVINPVSSNKSPIAYEIIEENMASKEMIDCLNNKWGWSSKVNANIGYLPGYHIAYLSDIPVSDGYSVIIKLSYQIYN